ncbi:membrane protein [Oxalobacteraceae bacterium GrIS 1.11]
MAPLPAPIPFARALRRVINCSLSEWLEHRASSKGAALAFYTLFSIAPILILVIAIAGFFYGTEAARGELLLQLRALVGAQGAETIQLVLAGASNHDEGRLATLVATALLLFGATSVFAELKASLDDIWQVPAPPDAGIWDQLRTRLLSFGLVLVLAFLLMVSLVVSAALAILERYWGGVWKDSAYLFAFLSGLISFAVIAALFAVIYKMLPRVRLSWRDVMIGALGTAALFSLGKYAIGVYIGNSGVASSFGAAGSMIALLLWVYYSAQIFFLGAEFARQYALQLGSLRDATKPP